MLYAFIENNKKIHIISDTVIDVLVFDQMAVYKNKTLLKYFATAASGVTPKYTSKNLNFPQTLTSTGSAYIFSFTPADIEQDGEYFTDGVYHFILSDGGVNPKEEVGVVANQTILCCMGKALQGKDTDCDFAVFQKVNVALARLAAADAAIRVGDITSAKCEFEKINCECDNCS